MSFDRDFIVQQLAWRSEAVCLSYSLLILHDMEKKSLHFDALASFRAACLWLLSIGNYSL